MTKICIICNEEFEPKSKFNPKQIYCSEKCREKAKAERKKYIRVGEPICEYCNTKFEIVDKFHPNQKFCSLKCSENAKYQRNRNQRILSNKTYRLSENGKKNLKKSFNKYKENNLEKNKAHTLIKCDKVKNPNKYKNFCQCCNSKKFINQHHEDYSKPYEVIALCSDCHTKIHKIETRFDILSILLVKGVWGN